MLVDIWPSHLYEPFGHPISKLWALIWSYFPIWRYNSLFSSGKTFQKISDFFYRNLCIFSQKPGTDVGQAEMAYSNSSQRCSVGLRSGLCTLKYIKTKLEKMWLYGGGFELTPYGYTSFHSSEYTFCVTVRICAHLTKRIFFWSGTDVGWEDLAHNPNLSQRCSVGLRSGLCARHLSSSGSNWSNHVFMVLALSWPPPFLCVVVPASTLLRGLSKTFGACMWKFVPFQPKEHLSGRYWCAGHSNSFTSFWSNHVFMEL